MAARRLILAMLVLLVLSSIAAALIPVDRDKLSDTSTSTSATTPVTAHGALIEKEVSTTAKEPPTIRMQVRDELRLTVKSPVPNMIEIPAFGELENVDPDLPAQFDLLAYQPGSFAVRLVDPPGLVARIDVSPR